MRFGDLPNRADDNLASMPLPEPVRDNTNQLGIFSGFVEWKQGDDHLACRVLADALVHEKFRAVAAPALYHFSRTERELILLGRVASSVNDRGVQPHS